MTRENKEKIISKILLQNKLHPSIGAVCSVSDEVPSTVDCTILLCFALKISVIK
ncbi:hypothetical protein MASR1M90_07150 [Desulfovibrionales bacterium]